MNRIKAKLVKRVLSKCKHLLSSVILTQELSGNDNYNIDIVDECFKPRVSNVDDSVLIERIVTAYNKAKVVQSESGDAYQVSNEWLPIYEKYMKKSMEALSSSDIDKVKTIFNNFMRESCSVGLHGLPVDMFKCYFSGNIEKKYKKLYLQDALFRYKIWQSTIGLSHKVEDLIAPDFGNSYGYYIDGNFIRTGADYLHYYATMIGRLVRNVRRPAVLELGGGYGGMAYYLLRDNIGTTYLDFDLPENLALTSFYLLSAFPNKNIALYGEVDLKATDLGKYDALLMPNFEIRNMCDESVDLVFNSYSLAEMSAETIAEYISQFNRISREYIFHVNHNKISKVKADNFEIDDGKFELLHKIPALWNLSRNIDMDEFEYLYKIKTNGQSTA